MPVINSTGSTSPLSLPTQPLLAAETGFNTANSVLPIQAPEGGLERLVDDLATRIDREETLKRATATTDGLGVLPKFLNDLITSNRARAMLFMVAGVAPFVLYYTSRFSSGACGEAEQKILSWLSNPEMLAKIMTATFSVLGLNSMYNSTVLVNQNQQAVRTDTGIYASRTDRDNFTVAYRGAESEVAPGGPRASGLVFAYVPSRGGR